MDTGWLKTDYLNDILIDTAVATTSNQLGPI